MNWQRTCATLERLRTRKGRRTEGLFSIEGYRLLERALESGVGLKRVLASSALKDAPPPRAVSLLTALEAQGCPIAFAPPETLEKFIEGRTFGPLLGIVEALPSLELAPLLQRRAETPRGCRLLVLVGATDPGNIGALSRTAMASGMDGMIAAGGTDIFHPKALRTSMGALFDLPTCQFSAWGDVLVALQHHGLQNIGAVVRDGQAPTMGELGHHCALWMGSEAHGLPADLQPQLDLCWTIPMPVTIESFSINAASAVLLYEINRRHDFW